MNLKITSYNNFCNVKGVLDKESVQTFKNELYYLVGQVNSLTLSFEGLDRIDRDGLKALAQIHNEFIRQQKQFSVIGLGSDEIYAHFKSKPAA